MLDAKLSGVMLDENQHAPIPESKTDITPWAPIRDCGQNEVVFPATSAAEKDPSRTKAARVQFHRDLAEAVTDRL
ncbi:MAG: hypothetical protein QM741_13870 [Rudaea sp.]|uniref:hypothetical protein n=1 Tax=Rudaea sp. TaxID=2136325 RepID=UPI0039E6A984